ncbi:MAG: hypothetical protein KKA42_06640, partial [candidate division Zixibacteria bacterium]|nr:hypothetical protein [candidate division Zixibacteria bacterium]
MRRTCICWLMALLPLLASYASVRAVERLSIDAGVDTTYLPYRLVTLQDNHESNRGAQLNRLAYIIEPGRGDSSQALILKIYNDHRPDYPAIIGMGRSPLYELVDDDAVPLTVRFWDVYRDNGTDSTTVCGAGHRNDSAFLFRLDPYTDQRRLLFLMTGEDATGDSAWVPNLEILSIVDYDYDGRHEAFVYVNRERDAGQRTLFCIEMEAMRIEWQLEVASPLSRNAGFWNCGDSTRPAVAFVGMCRGQGAQDANFDDHHGFFAVVDTSGKLIHQRVLSHKSDGVLLAPGELPGCAYLGHSFREPLSYDSVLALERAGMADTLTGDGFWISKVNREGEIVHTGRLDAAPLNVWLRPLG